MIGTLTHVRLLVRDYPACFRFYRDVMGLRATYGEEDTGYADFDAGAGVAVALDPDGNLIEINRPLAAESQP
jgi:catechol 2,3-dioxygenase-like lactoylglutathione lyase family enzyme